MFSIFKLGIEQTLQTLNLMIVSTIINFEANNLIYEDGFHAINRIFSRFINRLTLKPSDFQTVIILVLNTLHFFP